MNSKPSHAHHPPQYPPHYPPPQHHRQPPHYPQPPQHHRQPPHYSQQPPPQHHRQPQQQHRQPPHNLKQPPPPHYSQPPPPPPPPQQHRPPPPPQHPPPPPPPPPPHRPPKQPKPRRTTLASCIVATIFLTFLVILLCILYFSLLKPKDPKITITAIEIPTFTVSTNSTPTPTVSFTFSQYAAVHNPNRAAFHHFDSSLQLLYAGNQVAFMFIPAGNISARNTVYMSATFSVQSFPIMSGTGSVPAMEMPMPVVSDGLDRIQPTMEMEVKMEMVGRVRVLWFFTHHVESLADCRIEVAINDGSVLGFHC